MKQLIFCSKYFVVLFVLHIFLVTNSTAQQKSGAGTSIGSGSTGFGSGAAGPIGAGDLVEMSVFDTPELSGKLRVSNTGDIILPLVGSIQVAGMKATDVQNLIRQKFIDGGFLKDPQVTEFLPDEILHISRFHAGHLN